MYTNALTLRLHRLCVGGTHSHGLVTVDCVEAPSLYPGPLLRKGFQKKCSGAALPFSLTWEGKSKPTVQTYCQVFVGSRCITPRGEWVGCWHTYQREAFGKRHRVWTRAPHRKTVDILYCRWLIMRLQPLTPFFGKNKRESTIYKYINIFNLIHTILNSRLKKIRRPKGWLGVP